MIARRVLLRLTLIVALTGVGVALALPDVTARSPGAAPLELVGLYAERVVAEFRNHDFGLGHLPYVVLLPIFALVLECLFVGWSASSLRRLIRLKDGSSRNDLFYWLLNVLELTSLVRFTLTLGGAALVAHLVGKLNLEIDLLSSIEPPWLRYLAAFLLMDFMGYFQHRLAHSWGWWWELHKIHHSAEHFNAVTGYRTHVLESLPRAVLYGLVISVTGSWNAFVGYMGLLLFHNLLVHSRLQYSWGWLEYNLLVSPRNHRIHHSTDPAHHNRNFGFALIVWDRLFGTWHPPQEDNDVRIGLVDNPFNRTNPVTDLLISTKNSVAALLGLNPPTAPRQ